MAKVQEIGPYSAYAIAVKYGYQGTEEEWVQEQEANRKAAEAAAAAAAQSAKDAAASASGAAQSGQQAVQSIKNAQTAAEQAIDTAKQQAVQAAQAEAEKAATSAGQAASSAAEAAQSATNAAAEVGKVQSAGTSAVQAVQAAQNTATEAVSDAQQTATQAVAQAQTTAVSAVQAEGTTQTNAVASAASSALTDISGAKDAALSAVAEAGTAQVSAVGTAGTSAVQDVNDAKTAALEAIDAANAALPDPTQSDAGKVPTVKADGSAYGLAGPYAPLSAAIRPTASGNPVSITDSVEWPLPGLKVYGKSTQVTTTGAQLLNIPNKNQTFNGVTMNCNGGIAHFTGNIIGSGVTLWFVGRYHNPNVVFTLPQGEYFISDCSIWNESFKPFSYKITVPEGGLNVTGVSYTITQTGAINFVLYPMINAGSTAKPWEPYTGGQASPSLNYPQEIVSAGDDGNVDVSVTGKNLLDISKMQQTTENGITFSVENGGMKISGTATDSTDSPTFTFRLPAGTYISNMNKTRFPWLLSVSYVVEQKDGNLFWLNADSAFTVLDEDVGKYFYFAINEGETVNEIIYPQIEVGSTATPYEPYKSQSLTIYTPNGLPGIPVDSGGNYTDAEGQQSACDVKDYGTGKYTQMVGHIESYNGENITTPYMSTTGQLSTGAEVYYVLDEPVVTDISADELAAYKALHTYDGATVVSTAEDVSGLDVRYVADAQKYIDDRLTAAESHIQELAAAQLNDQTGG